MLINRAAIIEKLSNFYKDNSFGEFDIAFFVDLYEEMATAIEQILLSVRRNQTIRSMESFRKYNFAAFNGHEGAYAPDVLLLDDVNASLAGIDLTLNINARVDAWYNSTPTDKKIEVLTRAGKYIQLSARRPFDESEPAIIDLKLFDSSKNQYVDEVDYVLKSNRIFLFRDAAHPTSDNATMVATDIFVDYKTPEQLLGSRIGIGYSSEISIPEYRDFIQMVSVVLMNGPTIRNLKDAFSMLAGWEGANIIDSVSASGIRADMWHKPGFAVLTPFDFLITIPATMVTTVGLNESGQLIAKDDRINIFKNFLDVVKPVDTKYILALSEVIQDTSEASSSIGIEYKLTHDSPGAPADSLVSGMSHNADSPLYSLLDIFELSSLPSTIENSDLTGLNYGVFSSEDPSSPDAANPKSYGDSVSITHISWPEYPLSVSFGQNGSVWEASGTVNLKNVDRLDLMRDGVWVRSINLTPSGVDQFVVAAIEDTGYAALPPGTYRYKIRVRSSSTGDASRWSGEVQRVKS